MRFRFQETKSTRRESASRASTLGPVVRKCVCEVTIGRGQVDAQPQTQ